MESSDAFESLIATQLDSLLPRLAHEHYRVVASLKKRVNDLEAERAALLEANLHQKQMNSDEEIEITSVAGENSDPSVRRASTDRPANDVKILAGPSDRSSTGTGQTVNRQSKFFESLHIARLANDKAHEAKSILRTMLGDRSNFCCYRCLEFLFVWAYGLEEPARYGCLASIVDSAAFGAGCMLVIIASTGFTIHGANWQFDHLAEKPTSMMVAVEHGFLCWFVLELLLKFAVHRLYFFVGPDAGWNMFDLALVAMSTIETIAMSVEGDSGSSGMTFLRVLRVCKVVKVLRTIRLLRFIKDLRLMLECMIRSVLSIFWSLLLILFMIGFFSILFVHNMATWIIESGESLDSEAVRVIVGRFGSVQRALMLLIKVSFSGMDWGGVYDDILHTGPLNCVLFLLFILMFQLAFLNIITSVFIEKAMQISQPDMNELMREQQARDLAQARQLFEVVEKYLDVNLDGKVTQAQFKAAMKDRVNGASLKTAFEVRGVPINDAEAFFSTLTTDGEDGVPIELFVAGCLKMKGYAMSSDLQTLIVDAQRKSTFLRNLARQGKEQSALLSSLQHKVGSLMQSHDLKQLSIEMPREKQEGKVESSRVRFSM